MVNCNLSIGCFCKKHLIECTGSGFDLNGCPEWAVVQALQDLTECVREISNNGIGV